MPAQASGDLETAAHDKLSNPVDTAVLPLMRGPAAARVRCEQILFAYRRRNVTPESGPGAV